MKVPRPRPRLQTAAELAEIRARVDERHAENQRRFDNLDAKQTSIETKLDSLLASRSYVRGMVRMAILLAGTVSALVGWAVAWYKHP
jgi:hypothetical protein